jgi:hypothetical protein
MAQSGIIIALLFPKQVWTNQTKLLHHVASWAGLGWPGLTWNQFIASLLSNKHQLVPKAHNAHNGLVVKTSFNFFQMLIILTKFKHVWTCLLDDAIKPNCCILGWAGLAWAGLGWPGLAWAGLGWPGLAWAGLGLPIKQVWTALCCSNKCEFV